MSNGVNQASLTLADIQKTSQALAPFIRRTPCMVLQPADALSVFGIEAKLVFKLELMQVSGTFKARGALSTILGLTPEERLRGVTAVSAGNHAVAVAYAARALGTHARVIMIKTANPLRVQMAKEFGADVEMAEDGASAFVRAQTIAEDEGRYFVHPFEGRQCVLGSATLGAEWCEQEPKLDAVVVAVGGGGLVAGIGSAIAVHSNSTLVYGVEPTGASILTQSLAAGAPTRMASVNTIADSLAPPMTTPYTFEMCRRHVADVALVTDDELRAAMRLLFTGLKLAVEPAGAAALAAALGPLHARLEGRRVGILMCGANIDLGTFSRLTGFVDPHQGR